MLSSRSLYTSNDVDFYRRSDQRGMSLGNTPSLGDQYETNSQFSRNNSPESDPESKSAPPRKRVPVACGRCRKRKIKCSGDEGGNRGCSNCRNAGFAGCQFLRVQSRELPIGGQYQQSKAWPVSHRYSPYAAGCPSRSKPFTSIHYPDTTAYSALQTTSNFEPYQTTSTTSSWMRPIFAPQYGLAYSDESVGAYSPQPPPPTYMLPSTDPMNNVSPYYMSGNLGRSTNLWSDPVGSTTLVPAMTPSNGGNSNLSYGLHETTTSFNNANNPSADRILPTPSATRPLAIAPQSSLDTQCLSALSQRSSLGWNTDTPSSASGGSSRTSNSTDPDPRVVSAGPFGYIDVPSSTHDLADSTAGIEISASPNHESRHSSENSSRVRMGSGDSQCLGQSPRDMLNYPYKSSRSMRHQQSSSGRLMSGQLYQPLRTSSSSAVRGSFQQDCSPTTHDLNQDGAWQSHSQRSSVASLSNSSGFSNMH